MISTTLNAWIDGRPLTTKLGHTILQGCNLLSIDIPRFCYHEKLSIAGNCRICLVEVSNSKKLVVSCAAHLMEGLAVQTNSVRVKLARQGVIEFLLANHPLDCPICDQGGECDLQDITMVFGADRGRFYEYKKKAVANKDFGPLIKTSMNRCIHCTRCVRFISEVSNSYVLGTTGRGAHLEISTYINMALNDELSGNIIDLCPVGALTSKPYAFQSRPWELTSIESIDIMDSLVSNVYIETAFNKVKRVLPCLNEILNEDWITNRARFSYDGLTAQRLTSCYFKIDSSSIFLTEFLKSSWFSKKYFLKISWLTAFYILNWLFLDKTTSHFLITSGFSADFNSLSAAKFFFNNMGISSLSHGTFTLHKNMDFNFLYSFNMSIKEFALFPTFCLIIGINLRMEIPHLNLKFRRMVNDWNIPIYSIGTATNYSNFFITNLSNNLSSVFKILEFKHVFCKNFYKLNFSFYPFFLISNNVTDVLRSTLVNGFVLFLNRLMKAKTYNNSIFTKLSEIINPFNCIGFTNDYASKANAFALGFNTGIHSYLESNFYTIATRCTNNLKTILYSIGDDSNFLTKLSTNQRLNRFLIYQGSHGNGLANQADMILPTTTYIEKESTFLTLNNNLVNSRIVLAAPKQTKPDSLIFSAFFEFFLKKNLKFFFFRLINFRKSFQYAAIHMGYLNKLRMNYFFLNNNMSLNYFFLKTDFTQIKINSYYLLSVFGRRKLNNITFTKLAFTFLNYFLHTPIYCRKYPINTFLLNYYSDETNVILGASKVMVSCSNVFLKKNFSFSQYYIF